MTDEAKYDIAEDTLHDDASTPHDKRYHDFGATEGRCDCPECVMARLCDRQSAMIKAQDESRAIKDQRIAFLEAQVSALKEEIAAHVKGVA